MFSSSSSCSPIYVAQPPLWWYSTLLPRKHWRHKHNRFTNLMNHMKQLFLAAHLFHCSVVLLYLLQMSCFFFCVLLDVIGFNNFNNLMHELKLIFLAVHLLLCFVFFYFTLNLLFFNYMKLKLIYSFCQDCTIEHRQLHTWISDHKCLFSKVN